MAVAVVVNGRRRMMTAVHRPPSSDGVVNGRRRAMAVVNGRRRVMVAVLFTDCGE
jgi:hypothetical protein